MPPLRIAQVFNRYRTEYGGEYGVVRQTEELLLAAGHQVVRVEKSSNDLTTASAKLKSAFSGAYSFASRREFGDLLDRERPDIVHVHNLYPLFSPSVLAAAVERGTPTVMTVHNQGLTCPIGTHFSHGEVCERCVRGSALNAVARNCAGSMPRSAAYAFRFAVARRFALFARNVDRFLALTDSAAERLIRSGIDRSQITVLSNGVAIPPVPADPGAGAYCLFVGRLVRGKGAEVLVEAARRLPSVEFRVVGDGPEQEALTRIAPENMTFVGRLDAAGVALELEGARCLTFPSVAYEGLPLTVLEAMSHGVPPVASDLQGPSHVVVHDECGILVPPGDPASLAAAISRVCDSPDLARRLGEAARERATRYFSHETYLRDLLGVYRTLLARPRGAATATSEGS